MNAPTRLDDFRPWRPRTFIKYRPLMKERQQADAHVRAWKLRAALLDLWPTRLRPILFKACRDHAVNAADVLGTSRRPSLVRVRQQVMAQLRRETAHSLSWIGRLFDRDHTTVLYAVRKIEAERGRV